MISFKDDKEALEFLARFIASETWQWFEQVIKARYNTILRELKNPKLTSDSRAMLTGRLIELHEMLDFPVTSFEYAKSMDSLKKAEDLANLTQVQRDGRVARTAFPDIVTG